MLIFIRLPKRFDFYSTPLPLRSLINQKQTACSALSTSTDHDSINPIKPCPSQFCRSKLSTLIHECKARSDLFQTTKLSYQQLILAFKMNNYSAGWSLYRGPVSHPYQPYNRRAGEAPPPQFGGEWLARGGNYGGRPWYSSGIPRDHNNLQDWRMQARYSSMDPYARYRQVFSWGYR